MARVEVVVLAASLGGIEALSTILSELPQDFPVPIVIVQHRSARQPNLLTNVLQRRTPLKVCLVTGGERLQPGTVYLAPPDRHAVFGADGRLSFAKRQRISYVLSSADPLFESAAQMYGASVVAVVLSGTGHDGAQGALAVYDAGGTVLVQDRPTSQRFEMALAAIRAGAVDRILALENIAGALMELSAS